eukprot:XP_001611589.1 hypothetical protein [Babesia bovis T2Bo]
MSITCYPLVHSYRLLPRDSFSQVPVRQWSLYGKNRYAAHVKRLRRQRHFFVRRREQDNLKEPFELENAVTAQRIMLFTIFGKPLSQALGDGGVIPFITEVRDRIAHVREYYGLGSNRNQVVDDLCFKVANNPHKPRGMFRGCVPVAETSFYRDPEVLPEERAFNKAADYHEGMPPIIPDLDDHERENRFYSGLQSEVLFKHLPKELVKEMSAMEIDAKRGIIDPVKLKNKRRRDKSGTSPFKLGDIQFTKRS